MSPLKCLLVLIQMRAMNSHAMTHASKASQTAASVVSWGDLNERLILATAVMWVLPKCLLALMQLNSMHSHAVAHTRRPGQVASVTSWCIDPTPEMRVCSIIVRRTLASTRRIQSWATQSMAGIANSLAAKQ